MVTMFQDRAEAGRLLAERLMLYRGRPDLIVLGLPRGGVPVAAEVARALHAPLDVLVVRKLGAPNYPELAMGAVASYGARYLNQEVIQGLHIPPHMIEQVAVQELKELRRREKVYRGERLEPHLEGRTIILVDDGLATGSTMCAAVAAIQRSRPARIVVAVPVASPSACALLQNNVDACICLFTPAHFGAVGLWYEDFRQVSDDEVRDSLMMDLVPTVPKEVVP